MLYVSPESHGEAQTTNSTSRLWPFPVAAAPGQPRSTFWLHNFDSLRHVQFDYFWKLKVWVDYLKMFNLIQESALYVRVLPEGCRLNMAEPHTVTCLTAWGMSVLSVGANEKCMLCLKQWSWQVCEVCLSVCTCREPSAPSGDLCGECT